MKRLGIAAVPLLTGLLGLTLACTGERQETPKTPLPTSATVAVISPTATVVRLPTATPQPPRERARLVTNVSTKYYSVDGATTDEIFASIAANGPLDDKGERASGLTGSELDLVSNDDGASSCDTESVTITVEIVVTLPKVDHPEALPEHLLARWEKFSTEVAAHEQRHVDIFLDGANKIQQGVDAILSDPARCTSLASELRSRTELRSFWESQQRLTDQEQDQFHEAEEARLAAARAALQAQIDSNEARLADLGSQTEASEANISSLESQASALESELKSLEAELRSIERMHPGRVLPEPVYSRYENLRTQYNSRLSEYNSVFGQYESALARHNSLLEEHNALLSATNDLIDELNWLR